MISKVVSVEDDAEIAELLQFVVGHPQIELHHADNGLDALTLIRTIKPDLVILDVMMPKMNGWEVYDTLRADDAFKATPVIMLSVMREFTERRRAFVGSEIDLYVTKPFDALRLRREVARMLNRLDLWEAPKPKIAHAFGVTDTPAAPPPDTVQTIAPDAPPTDVEQTQQAPAINNPAETQEITIDNESALSA
jgi:DNA-binding response OmpR family regulator